MNPKATQYANSKVPNPDRNDAPYFTSRDRWQDVYEAYEAGEKEKENRVKELEEALREVLRLMKERRHEVAGLGACITIAEVALMQKI